MVLPELLQSKTAEIVAIASAAMFPLGLIFLKKGYDHSTPLYGTLIVTAINAVFLWIFALLFSSLPLTVIFSSAVVFFIIAGAIGHGIARLLQFTGVDKVGPARNTIALATSALFGAVIAVLFRGEKWTLPIFLGTIAIVGGIAVLARESKKTKWNPTYLALPITAAFLYGIMTNVYKAGLEKIPDAAIGAAVGLTAALFTLTVVAAASAVKEHGRIKIPSLGKAMPLFLAAGIINSVGLILNFEAIKLGDVTVVFPLISAHALFAWVFGFLFLRQTERISLHVVAGAVVVVAGIAMITVF
ncbi:MAG: EamA family transporter [Nanoarchaeota archaeon]